MDTDIAPSWSKIRIDIGSIEDMIRIVSLLGHTQYPTHSLYLEYYRLHLTEHHEDLSTRTVPSSGDGLLEYEHFDRTLFIIYELFVRLVIREPYSELVIRESDTMSSEDSLRMIYLGDIEI